MSFPPPTERQARLIWLAVTGLAIAVLVALVAALIWGLGRAVQLLAPVLWPLAVAGVVAYLLDPVVDFLQRHGLKRPRAIVSVCGLALVIVLALCGSLLPQVITETRQLAARIPEYVAKGEQRITTWVNNPPPLVAKFLERLNRSGPDHAPDATTGNITASSTNAVPRVVVATNTPPPSVGPLNKDTLQAVTDWLAKVLPHVGPWLFGQVGRVASWFAVLAGIALIPVYAFYFLLEKQGISSRWTDYLPVADSRFKTELVFVLESINNYLISFFRGQVLVATCDGLLYGLGFLLVGIQYAALIGVVAVFLTMIPYIGALVICLTALTISIFQYGDWRHPLLVLAVFACVQTLEGLVISPRIMGGRVGLHPVTIIIAVMAGTTLLGGLLGGILAIPLTAALRVVMFRYVWKREA
jgi:predicted PurR-regulated permease PerM